MTKTIFAAFFGALLLAGQARAAGKYYVDIGGDNGGVGAESSPLKTLAGGVAKLKDAGDEVIVRHGLYVGSIEIKGLKGNQGSPIVIRGIREPVPPEDAKLPDVPPSKYAPQVRADKDNALVIRDCSFLRIEGLVLTGAKQAGVIIEDSDHVTLKDCDVLDNGGTQVLSKAGRYIALDHCELAGSVLEHGVRFWMTDQPQVSYCRIHHNSASGIYLDGDKKSGGDGLIDGPIIEGNVLYANGKLRDGVPVPRDAKGHEIKPVALRNGSAAIAGDGFERGAIRNNLIHHNFVGAIVLYQDDAARAGQNNRIVHNTIYLPASSGGAYGIQLATMTQGTTVHNNVVVTAQGPAVFIGAGSTRDLQSDYNVLFRLDGKEVFKREKEDLPLARWQQVYRSDRNSIQFSPPFVDPDNTDLAKCDFQLKPESKLGGRGPYQWDAQTDLLIRWRPRDRVTPGAYELAAVSVNPNAQPQPQPGQGKGRGGPPPKDPPKDPSKDAKPPPAPPAPPAPPDGTVVLPPM